MDEPKHPRYRDSEGSRFYKARDLTDVCVSFNGGVEQLGKQNASLLEQTRVAGAMYAGILRVHPFADGNHRTGFVALSTALWSLGLPAVEFTQDADMTDHDDAVAPSSRPTGTSSRSRGSLRRVSNARRSPRHEIPSGHGERPASLAWSA